MPRIRMASAKASLRVDPSGGILTKLEPLIAKAAGKTALLDELKRFRRVRWTTASSTEDIRYTLDYIVNWYMIDFYRSNVVGFYSFNAERQRLSSQVLLVVQDALKDEAVLEQTLIIHQNFLRDFEPDDESILDAFYQEAAHTVAREVSPLFD